VANKKEQKQQINDLTTDVNEMTLNLWFFELRLSKAEERIDDLEKLLHVKQEGGFLSRLRNWFLGDGDGDEFSQ
jgi:hypothetical protein